MADDVYQISLFAKPLTTEDAAGRLADVVPQSMWQPTMIAESKVDSVAMTNFGFAANNEKVLLRGILLGVFPDIAWLMVRMHVGMSCIGTSAGFESLWQTFAHYTPYYHLGTPYLWRDVTLPTPRTIFNGTADTYVQDVDPDMNGWPYRLYPVDVDSTPGRVLCGMNLTVQTYDGTAVGTTYLYFDWVALGFPRAAMRSAGLYTPRLFHRPSG